MKVIVNADDCGYSQHVNKHIKLAIDAGKVTSTTIMANMSDVEGALALFEQYKDEVSFGVHLNLTEGEPLLPSKTLLDYGYYAEKDGMIVFDGSRAESFRYKRLPAYVKKDIYKELSAQINKLRSLGIDLSHIDSHHHIHTSFSLISIMSQICKDFNIHKIRRIRNYVPRSMNYYGRQAWAVLSRMKNRNYIMTDYFAIFEEYFNQNHLITFKEKDSIELMIHPGNLSENYRVEESFMFNNNYPNNFELINYNKL